MEERETIIIEDFLGLIDRPGPTSLPNNSAFDILNLDLYNRYAEVRPGWDTINASDLGAKVTGIYQGFNNILITIDYPGTDPGILGTLVGSSVSAIFSPLVNEAIPSFASYNALDMMVNGSGNDNPVKWDGVTTSASLGGSPPKADDIEVWRNHVFLTGLASPNQGEVRFSELENPELWPSGHFLRPSKREEGANLICSKVVPFPGEEDGSRLAVFAKDRIFHFDGFTKSLFQIYLVKKGLGSVSKRGHVNAEGFHYWFAQDGIYCTPNGGYDVNNISWNIQRVIEDITPARYAYIQAHHCRNRRQVWWAVTTGGAAFNNKILVYNYGRSTPMAPAGPPESRHVWSVYNSDDGAGGFGAIAEYFDTTENKYRTMIGEGNAATKGGWLYAFEDGDGTDNGVDIDWRYLTPYISLTNNTSRNVVIRKLSMMYGAIAPPASFDVTMLDHRAAAPPAHLIQTIALSGTAVQKVVDAWWNQQAFDALFLLEGSLGANTSLQIYRLEIGLKQLRGTT